MTRIILEELNKKLKKEYKLRFFSVLFFTMTIVLLINISLISSSYLLLSSYEKSYTSDSSYLENEQKLKTREELNQKTFQVYTLIEKIPQKTSAIDAKILELVFGYAENLIKLESIELLSEDTSVKISVRGTSLTREDLLQFQEVIKKDSRFTDFNIPVETLAKQTDVSFNVTFIYYEN